MRSSFHQIAFKLAQSGSESLPLSCDPLSIMCQVTGLMKTNKYNSMAFRFNKRENLDGFSLNLYTPWEPSKHTIIPTVEVWSLQESIHSYTFVLLVYLLPDLPTTLKCTITY